MRCLASLGEAPSTEANATVGPRVEGIPEKRGAGGGRQVPGAPPVAQKMNTIIPWGAGEEAFQISRENAEVPSVPREGINRADDGASIPLERDEER
jgi:hypothetical protein